MIRSASCRVAAALSLTVSACVHRPVRAPDAYNMSYRRGPFAVHRELSAVDTLRVGDHPKSVRVSPDNRWAYICNLEQGTVDVLNASDGRRARQIVFPRTAKEVFMNGKRAASFEEKPVEIAFTGKGRYVWISLLNADGVVVYDTWGKEWPADGTLKTVTLRDFSRKASRQVPLLFVPTSHQPKVIAVSEDEKWVFVANWKGQSVTIIDPKKFRRVKDVAVGWLPRGICFAGPSAFVANFGSHTISEISLKTLKCARTLKNVGKNPRHLVTSPSGETFYVSNHGDGVIREIDAISGRTLRQCNVGAEPRTIALSKHENFLFVTNYHEDTSTVLDLFSMSEVMRVPTVRRPIGVSVDPSSDTVWVTGYWDRVVQRYRFASAVNKAAKAS